MSNLRSPGRNPNRSGFRIQRTQITGGLDPVEVVALGGTVQQVTETGTAQTFAAKLKNKAITQNTETDSIQVVTRVKSKALTQNTETDSIQAIATKKKTKAVTQTTESDSIQAMTHKKTKEIGSPFLMGYSDLPPNWLTYYADARDSGATGSRILVAHNNFDATAQFAVALAGLEQYGGMQPIVCLWGVDGSISPATYAAQVAAAHALWPNAIIELWNEPNHPSFGDFTPAEAAALVDAAVDAAPTARIIGPAVSPIGSYYDYVDDMVDAMDSGTLDALYGLGLHLYPDGAGGDPFQQVKTGLDRVGTAHNKDVYITEIGFPKSEWVNATFRAAIHTQAIDVVEEHRYGAGFFTYVLAWTQPGHPTGPEVDADYAVFGPDNDSGVLLAALDTAQSTRTTDTKPIVEEDTPLAMTHEKQRTLGQNTETDTAQAITVNPKRRLVNQITETDTVTTMAASKKTKLLGQITETDSIQAITKIDPILAALGQNTETDSIQAIAASKKSKALTQNTETDSQATITSKKTKEIGVSEEGGATEIGDPVLLDATTSNLIGTHISTLTTSTTVPAGAKLILMIAWVRDNDPGTVSITDDAGLTWTEDVYIADTGHDNDMVQQVYSAPAPSGLASGTDIDLELSSAEGSAWGFLSTLVYAEGVGDYETSTWYTVYGYPGDREFWDFPMDTTNPDCLLLGSHFVDGNSGANIVDSPSVEIHEELDVGNGWCHQTMYQIVDSPQNDFIFEGENANNVPYGQSFLQLAYEGLPVAAEDTVEIDEALPITPVLTTPELTVELGLNSETDSINAVSSKKSRTSGQNTETDTIQPITSKKVKAIAQNTETDTINVVSVNPKRRLVNLNSETDSIEVITRKKSRTLGQVTETDTAQPITADDDILALTGLNAETDSIQPITVKKTKAIGQNTETDVIFPIAVVDIILVAINQNTETDSVQPITHKKTKVLGQITETDTAQPIDNNPIRRAVAQNTETDTAQPLAASKKVKAIGLISETDTPLSVTVNPQRRLLGQNTETQTIFGLTEVKSRTLTMTSESNTIHAIANKTKVKILGLNEESDTAQSISSSASYILAINEETDEAQPITVILPQIVELGLNTETDVAQPVATDENTAVLTNTETDTAQPITAKKTKTTALNTETDLAQPISLNTARTISVSQVNETDSAGALGKYKLKGLGQLTEAQTPLSVTRNKRLVAGLNLEVDEIASMTPEKAREIIQQLEIDEAQTLAHSKLKAISQTTEADTANSITPNRVYSIGQNEEFSEVFSIISDTIKVRLLGQPSELDAAQPVNKSKRKLIGFPEEEDEIFGIATRSFGSARFRIGEGLSGSTSKPGSAFSGTSTKPTVTTRVKKQGEFTTSPERRLASDYT